jgi:hypothetical protein
MRVWEDLRADRRVFESISRVERGFCSVLTRRRTRLFGEFMLFLSGFTRSYLRLHTDPRRPVCRTYPSSASWTD